MNRHMTLTAASLLAVILLSAPLQAVFAATVNIGALTASTPYINPVAQGPGNFSDIYNFSVTGQNHAIINATAVDLAPFYSISGLSLSLFDAPDAVGTPLASGSTISWLLADGNHSFRIDGQADGTGGGFYTAAIAVSPVPLPAAFWLMLSALAGIGGLLIRTSITPALALSVLPK